MLTGSRGDDELVAVKRGECRCVGAEELERLLDDGLEHGNRIKLGREEAPGPRQLLRERARARARPRRRRLRSSAPRAAPLDLLRELEILARELPRFAEEHEHERRSLARDGDRQKGRERATPPGVVESLVAGQRRAATAIVRPSSAASSSARGTSSAAIDSGKLVRADEDEIAAAPASAPRRSRRRVPRLRRAPRCRRSRRATTARQARSRSGRSRAALGPDVRSPQSSRHCEEQARRGWRRPPRDRCRPIREPAAARAAIPTPRTPRTAAGPDHRRDQHVVKSAYAGCGTGDDLAAGRPSRRSGPRLTQCDAGQSLIGA